LQQHHAGDLGVGGADRFQRAELLQVLDDEEIERLRGDRDADDDGERDGDAEIDRNARAGQVIFDAAPGELDPRQRLIAGLALDTAGKARGVLAAGGGVMRVASE
jgi:hypothetical protein